MYQANVNQPESSLLSRVNGVVPGELEVQAIANLYEHNPVESEQKFTKLPSEQRLEYWLCNILKYGVLMSCTIVLIGGILYLIRHGTEPANYHIFQGEPAVFRSPGGVVTAILSGQRRGIIQLGILLLIATPIVRVAFSVLAFIRQRDFSYIILTFIVLSGLIYSFIGAYYTSY